MRVPHLTRRLAQPMVVTLLGVGVLALVLVSGFFSTRAGHVNAAAASSSSTSIFARIVGARTGFIHGDAATEAYAGQIVVDSTSFGATNPAATTGTGGGHHPSASPFTFTAHTAQDSPLLFKALVTGELLRTATFTFVRFVGDSTVAYQTYAFTNCLFTSVQQAASTDRGSEDTVQLQCQRLTYTFVPLQPNGTTGTPVIFTWDLQTNTVG